MEIAKVFGSRPVELIDVALGDVKADLVVQGGKLVNVLTREIYPADVAVKGDRIAAIGEVDYTIGNDTVVVDGRGRYVTPGLIETHLHFYETQLNVNAFVEALLPHGTTTYPNGFYGEANVAGKRAVRFMVEATRNKPMKFLFQAPLVSYLQSRRLGLPPTPKALTADDLLEMLDWERNIGLEECRFLDVIDKDPGLLRVIEKAVGQGKAITGHVSGYTKRQARQANAYAAMGAFSDHESVSAEEAIEKARLGIKILIREGSAVADAMEISRAVSEYGLDPRSFAFDADTISAHQAVREGHLDNCIRKAIAAGVPPIVAVQMATINAAEYLRLDSEIGSVTPGKIADILLVDELRTFGVSTVIADGKVVAQDGKLTVRLEEIEYPDWMRQTVTPKRQFLPSDFEVKVTGDQTTARVRVVGTRDGTILSTREEARLAVRDGKVQMDPSKDVIKLAMADRYGVTDNVGTCFIGGFGLKAGAIATSYQPNSQHLMTVGASEADMAYAVNRLAEIGGGHIVVKDGQTLALLELPLFGLGSDAPLDVLFRKYDEVQAATRSLGCTFANPFHQLAFCGAISPDMITYKIHHTGLFDASERRRVPIVIE